MERKMFKELQNWKNSKKRSPLLLQGARQVGKTYTALEFGRREFANTVYLNFEGTQYLKDIFEPDLEPHRIIRAIEAHTGQTILPEKTLTIFDEIQAAEPALTSLKYFCEAAGSLHFYRKKYDIPFAYRISARNFGYEDGIKSVPLYAVFTIS
ncbi:MAG: AAA family ATPase [Anaerovibrio sp.]